MVAPFAVDLQVVLGIALLLEPVLLEHPARGHIAGEESGMNAVELQRFKHEWDDDADRLRHQPPARVLLAHPVAEIDVLRGPPPDIGERNASNKLLVPPLTQVDEEGVVGALACLFAAPAKAGEIDGTREVGLAPSRLIGL